MNPYYYIDGVNIHFKHLWAAKYHVYVAFTQEERKKYLRNTCITKVYNEEIVTTTPIIVTDNSYSFGKTKKY